MTEPVCPKCGTPPRVVIVERARVRCAYKEDGSVGRVISVTKDTKVTAYECGGGHTWPVARELKETAE